MHTPAPEYIRLIVAGPASLTLARDLAPLGYDITVFEAEPRAGDYMRSQAPRRWRQSTPRYAGQLAQERRAVVSVTPMRRARSCHSSRA